MKYRVIGHRISEFMSTNVEVVYEISSDQECQYTTLPNGLVGLTMILSGSVWYFKNAGWTQVPASSTYGLIKKTGLIRMSSGCREISIGFRPPLLRLFLKNSMKEIAGGFTDAESLFKTPALAELRESIHNPLKDRQLVLAIEKFLKCHYTGDNEDRSAITGYSRISEDQSVKISALAAELKVPSRTLLNKFNNSIGLTPMELLKVQRINRALKAGINNGRALTRLALDLGYYDQAHFIHDFRDTLGLCPENYFKNTLKVADFYNSGRWLLR